MLARGYRGATFHDAVHAPPAPKTFAVTFDDAYRSVIELGFPILSRLGVPGTVFVPTSFTGSEEPMSWPGIDHWLGGPHESELVPMSWEELDEACGGRVGDRRAHPDPPPSHRARRRHPGRRAAGLAARLRVQPRPAVQVLRLSVLGRGRAGRKGDWRGGVLGGVHSAREHAPRGSPLLAQGRRVRGRRRVSIPAQDLAHRAAAAGRPRLEGPPGRLEGEAGASPPGRRGARLAAPTRARNGARPVTGWDGYGLSDDPRGGCSREGTPAGPRAVRAVSARAPARGREAPSREPEREGARALGRGRARRRADHVDLLRADLQRARPAVGVGPSCVTERVLESGEPLPDARDGARA